MPNPVYSTAPCAVGLAVRLVLGAWHKSFQGTASNQEMSAEAKQIRHESPAQVEQSVELLENTPSAEVNLDD